MCKVTIYREDLSYEAWTELLNELGYDEIDPIRYNDYVILTVVGVE